MSSYRIQARWVTAESQAKLSAVLGLSRHLNMQDWEFVCADSRRLGEFLDLYEQDDLSDDDRFALMALIVSSLDDWLQEGEGHEATHQRVRRHLLANFELHEWTVHYWSSLDEEDPDNLFAATAFMREVWNCRHDRAA